MKSVRMSCPLGPPMVVGETLDGLRLVEQFDAALHQCFLYLLDLFEEAVGHGLVG